MKSFFILLSIFQFIYSKKIELDSSLSLEYEIVNPLDPLGLAEIKFKLILQNGASGWASIGFRREPDKYMWPMANTDYIVCYENDPEIEGLGCFDGYMLMKDEIAADDTEWNDYIPRPLPDSHSAVKGTDDVIFLANESSKVKVGNDIRTEWVFIRKANTGDPLDFDLTRDHARAIWGYHHDRAVWEKDPAKWSYYNIGAYHGESFGHFLFFLVDKNNEL